MSDGSEWRDGCVGEGGRAAGVTRTDVRSTAELDVAASLLARETIGNTSGEWQSTQHRESLKVAPICCVHIGRRCDCDAVVWLQRNQAVSKSGLCLDCCLYGIGAPSGDRLALAGDDNRERDKTDDQKKSHAPQ